MSPRRLVICCVGFLLSGISVASLVLLVDLADVGQTLRSARPGFIVLAGFFLLVTYPLRAYRWGILLEPVAYARRLHLLSAQSVGLMANMLLPAHLGDIARGVIIARRTGISNSAGIATVVAERILDVMANVSILLLVWVTVRLPGFSLHLGARGWELGVGGMLGATVAIVLFLRSQTDRKILACLTRAVDVCMPQGLMARARNMVGEIRQGLQVFACWRKLATAMLLSLVLWGILGILNYLAMLALGVRLPLHAAFVALLAQTVGVSIPSSPGYVGTFHMATVVGLSLYGLDPEVALSVALLVHTMGFMFNVIMGVPFVLYEGLSLHQLWGVTLIPR